MNDVEHHPVKKWGVKLCGNAHAWCRECRPQQAVDLKQREFTPEHRARIAAAKRGVPKSPESRAAQSAKMRGRTLTSEHRAKISESLRGRPVTVAANAKRRASMKAHIAACNGSCGSGVCMKPASPTRIEVILRDVVLAEFPEVLPEKRFGPYSVDAYLPPPYHLAFEADGSYWHGSDEQVGHDAERDSYLLREHNLPVVRLGERELLEA